MNGFLSYSRLDAETPIDGKWVERLDAVLQGQVSAELGDNQLEIWRDRRNLLFGDRWSVEIERALDQADLFFCVLSSGWLKSEWCRREYTCWRRAHAGRDAFVIRFRHVDGTAPDIAEHLPLLEELWAYQQVDLENPTDLTKAEIDRKLAAMSRDLATKVRRLRDAPPARAPREAGTADASPPPPPVPLNGRRVVDGYVDMPLQSSNRVLLDIGFIERAATTVRQYGWVVFGVRAATLTTQVSEGRITDVRAAFGQGYASARVSVQVQPTARRVMRHMDIRSLEGATLSENPLRDRHEQGGPIELFSVEGAGPDLCVSAVVRIDPVGLSVLEVERSCGGDREQRARESMLLKIGELILRRHGNEFELGEYRRGEAKS